MPIVRFAPLSHLTAMFVIEAVFPSAVFLVETVHLVAEVLVEAVFPLERILLISASSHGIESGCFFAIGKLRDY